MGILDKIIVQGESLWELIPQGPPMIMVDKLYYIDQNRTITGFTINKHNIFCQDGVFREPGLIENIAQTAAVRSGYFCRYEKNEKVQKGFIGAVKNLIIYFLPEINSEIYTEIKIEHNIFDVTIISGVIKCKGRKVAECEMKIFLTKEN